VLVALRLLLATVFAVAGVAKLADRTGTGKALREFLLPAVWVPILALALPLAEIGTALALLPATSARYGALAALCLLLAISAAIGVNLLRGRTPDCHCFGQIHSKPVGWRTLARNGALAVAAAFVTLQGWSDPGPSAMKWWGSLTIAQGIGLLGGAVALALLAAETWLLVHLLGQNGRLLMRLDALEARLSADAPTSILVSEEPAKGLPVDAPAPPFALADLEGSTHSLDELRALRKSILLVFAEPGCGACGELLPEVGRWQQQHAEKLTFVVVSRGTARAHRVKSAYHSLEWVLLQGDREVMDAYGAYGTPSAVVVRTDGAIGSPLAQGAAAIRALVAYAAEAPLLLRMLPILTSQAAYADAKRNGKQ
jgi:peroxiredoxin